MADWTGAISAYPSKGVSVATQVFSGPAPLGTFSFSLAGEPLLGASLEEGPRTEARAVTGLVGALSDSPSDFWFERLHLDPEALALGNVLGPSTSTIELYNAHREAALNLTDAENNAGEGLSFLDLPSLPYALSAQNGLLLGIGVTLEGPFVINGTLDFTFSAGALSLLVTGTRVVMLVLEPETPILEALEWSTNILSATNGTEQRQSLRRYPRQSFEMRYLLEADGDWRKLKHSLFSAQAGAFGVPLWHEARLLTTDVAEGDTTINVNTQYGDFRVGGSVVVWGSPSSYDALEIESMTENTLVLTVPVSRGYTVAGTLVMPLRVSFLDPTLTINKHQNNLEEMVLTFLVVDNKVDLADASAYGTHNGKVLLDDPNAMGDTLPENFFRDISRLDNGTSSPLQYSDWSSSRITTAKGWICNSLQEIWKVRQLVHALHGSRLGFYLPSFYSDVVPLALGSSTLDIEFAGYTSFVQGREPLTSLWIELSDGTSLTRQVVDQEVVDENTERLTLDEGWPGGILVTDIARISYLRLCRMGKDIVNFEHSQAGVAKVQMEITAVQS